MEKIKFYISQYFDGNLEIECNHMHYMYKDGFNFDDFPREELIDRMAEIQEHCLSENILPIFEVK